MSKELKETIVIYEKTVKFLDKETKEQKSFKQLRGTYTTPTGRRVNLRVIIPNLVKSKWEKTLLIDEVKLPVNVEVKKYFITERTRNGFTEQAIVLQEWGDIVETEFEQKTLRDLDLEDFGKHDMPTIKDSDLPDSLK